MKLFVDDERLPPTLDKDWVLVRDPNIAMLLMQNYPGQIEILSLDHDLGNNVPTGYDIAAWLEKEILSPGPWKTQPISIPKILRVHSANPVGRLRILQAFESIARFCDATDTERPKIEA